MKLNRKGLLIVATAACFATTVHSQTIQAGQWLDSVLGRRPPAYPVGTPVPVNGQVSAYSPGAYPSLGYVPPAYANLNGNPNATANSTQALGYGSYAPNNNAPLLPPGFPQTVAGQLPTAAYDSQWARTPVTYYRPVTAYDPRYGSVVTSLQPCTSYQYTTQRQPVIAPRPLLGDYGMQANRWPSITGPGYNPTGLANAPTYPGFQNIPNAGMPVVGQQASMAPVGGAGVSSGMPSSTMPMTTMQYNPASAGQPYASQQAYYGGQSYATNYTNVPNYANVQNVPNVGWPTQAVGSGAIGSGVVPTAAWLPSNAACPNGMCPPQPNQMNVPNIPGAASVTAVGPPTYSSVPNAANGNAALGGYNPGSNYQPTPAYGNPQFSAPTNNLNPNAAPPVMPNMQAMPPVNNFYADPDANVRPKLSANSIDASRRSLENTNVETPNRVQTIPLVAIDREPSPKSRETASSLSNPNNSVTNNPLPLRDAVALGNDATLNDTSGLKPGVFDSAPPIPATLAPRGNVGMQPLNTPEELDSNPRWTPTLLDPDDRVAMERKAAKQREAKNRIRLQEEQESAVSAVAMESSKSSRNPIQLVSGIETKKLEPAESNVIRFRPISKLK